MCRCAPPSAAGAALPDSKAASTLQARTYKRVKLVDEAGQPIRAASLKTGATYVFDYPFSSTPCFLLRLEKPTRKTSRSRPRPASTTSGRAAWGRAQHRRLLGDLRAQDDVSHEAGELHRLPQRAEPRGRPRESVHHLLLRSQRVRPGFRRARGAPGPAPQPLATILLQHDAKADELFAVGTFGGEKFAEFFSKSSSA